MEWRIIVSLSLPKVIKHEICNYFTRCLVSLNSYETNLTKTYDYKEKTCTDTQFLHRYRLFRVMPANSNSDSEN